MEIPRRVRRGGLPCPPVPRPKRRSVRRKSGATLACAFGHGSGLLNEQLGLRQEAGIQGAHPQGIRMRPPVLQPVVRMIRNQEEASALGALALVLACEVLHLSPYSRKRRSPTQPNATHDARGARRTNSRSAKRSMHLAISASVFAAAVGFRSLRYLTTSRWHDHYPMRAAHCEASQRAVCCTCFVPARGLLIGSLESIPRVSP